jgi:hypothetical protein
MPVRWERSGKYSVVPLLQTVATVIDVPVLKHALAYASGYLRNYPRAVLLIDNSNGLTAANLKSDGGSIRCVRSICEIGAIPSRHFEDAPKCAPFSRKDRRNNNCQNFDQNPILAAT